MNKQNTALITGASGGIGKALAELHAAKGGDLILVARSEDKLHAIKADLEQRYQVSVMVLVEDLTDNQAADRIYAATSQAGMTVDILINNAGFGGRGRFFERQLEADQQMMQVNMVALTNLTHHYLKDMVARNSGKILNVSSTASFMPGPLQAVYFATKAYVTSFSQALAEEVAEYNVTVTALCPGPVDTGFVAAGNLDGLEAWDKAKSPQSVAEFGYRAMQKGRLIAINESGLSFLLNWIVPFLPRKTVLKMARRFMEK